MHCLIITLALTLTNSPPQHPKIRALGTNLVHHNKHHFYLNALILILTLFLVAYLRNLSTNTTYRLYNLPTVLVYTRFFAPLYPPTLPKFLACEAHPKTH